MAEFIIDLIADVITDIWTLQCLALAAEETGASADSVQRSD